MSTPTIIFDLDGTLIDTAPDLIDTLNIVLSREGLPAVGYDEARGLIGFGARRMIERGLALSGKTVSAAEINRMFDDFIAHYSEHIADKSRPFPGLETALDALAAQGCRFAVCTNKLERLSVVLLESLGLAARFEAICGQDTFGVQKPDPGALLGTLNRVGGIASLGVMVGDSQTDVLAARASGLPVVAVDFGYTDIPVRQLGPDRIISHFAELPDAVAALLAVSCDGTRAPALASGGSCHLSTRPDAQ